MMTRVAKRTVVYSIVLYFCGLHRYYSRVRRVETVESNNKLNKKLFLKINPNFKMIKMHYNVKNNFFPYLIYDSHIF